MMYRKKSEAHMSLSKNATVEISNNTEALSAVAVNSILRQCRSDLMASLAVKYPAKSEDRITGDDANE